MPIKIVPMPNHPANKKKKKKAVPTPKPRPKRGDLNDLQASRDYNKYFKKKKK